MEKKDKVSVCIPAFNAGKYLPYMLDSIVGQSYGNIEIIVSDNASTDNTHDVIAYYAHLDGRIIPLRNMENIGYVKNIERAVAASSSEIIAIFHADDIYEKDIIEKELAVLNNRDDISAIFAKTRHFYGMLPENKQVAIEPWEKLVPYDASVDAYYGKLDQYIPIILEIGNIFSCPSLMTRRNDYISLGGFSENYPSNEDLELWIKYLRSGRMLAITSSTLINYRHSAEQGSAYWERQMELPAYYRVIDEMLMPIVDDGSKSSQIYKLRKSSLCIGLAHKVPYSDPRRLSFLKESAITHLFPINTVEGLIQRYPKSYRIIVNSKKNLDYVRKRMMLRHPGIYAFIKKIYHLIVLNNREIKTN